MADGEVIEGSYLFFQDTYALEVKHDNGMVVRYSEIAKIVPRGIMIGARVSKGQVIARVGRLYSGASMLHTEMYEGTKSGLLTQRGNPPYYRRSDLVDPTPFLDNAPLWNEQPLQPGEGRVNNKVTSVLNLRTEASTSSLIILTLSPGSICTVVEKVIGSPYPPDNMTQWYKVQHAGQSGFVAAYYLDVAEDSPGPFIPENSEGRVNERVTSALNVRTQPSTSSPVIFTLNPGIGFKVLEEVSGSVYTQGRTDWCKIEYNGQQGFAAAYYIDINQRPRPLTQWDKVLLQVPTGGASAATAGDGLAPGVAASHAMAQTDLARVQAIANRFYSAASMFGVPTAILAAIASRESRCGNVLSREGWGDHDNGFGVMQVDKNYHTPQGTHDPKSLEHIEQATGIFAQCIEQVKHKHPDWEDIYVLKGAAVAYNSGINNVQTKAGMDIGTTGNDYGSDVIARAQYYANHVELSMFRIGS